MSFTFNDNGEEWTIWQFEDKGEDFFRETEEKITLDIQHKYHYQHYHS